LKVVKGSLMESSGVKSGSGSLKTLIFLIPPSASSQLSVFESLSALINSTFQQTTPIVVDVNGA
uniref:STAS domain-containing protein n=1 Tax=Rodentolepis nana TaxID=102285 RepID=A0A0R3TD16_RODNA